jgi:uncharacterized repeat protein (TIGR03803 family)
MKTGITTLHNESSTCGMAAPATGGNAAPARLIRLLWAAVLLLPAFGAQAGVVLTTLSSFPVFPNGENPEAALVQGSDGNFFGTTYAGGANGAGTVFKVSATGALTSLYSFTGGDDGAGPNGLVQGSDGYFYGTTENGGTNDAGAVFKISATGALTSLYSFTGGNDGANPVAGLVQGSDGYFYGTTAWGGMDTNGTVFQMSAGGALTSLYSFTGGNDGANPVAALVQGSDGYFYGTTVNGGTNDAGTVFKISADGALTGLYSFTGTNDGGYPEAALVEGSDSNFYCTTSLGGTNDAGTVFKITTSGALTSLYSFTGGNDGDSPVAGLVQGSDGYFYSTTCYGGGTNDAGTVFKITTNGALTSLYSFTGGNDGAEPLAGLVQGSDGYFYGTTYYGGTHGIGTVFKISSGGALTSLYSFTGGNDGYWPEAELAQGSDGNFYGTASRGGTTGYGTVFKISATGALTSLYSFTGGNDGAYPEAGLVQGSDGNFYSTTSSGGMNGGSGTVFEISTNGALTSLYSFTGGNDGALPNGLAQGTDGYFYGTTYYGGTNDAGTVFKISATGALTSLYSFTGGNDGSRPDAGLVQSSDGYFYGTTKYGGTNGGWGTVFKISAAGALTSLYSFTSGNDGAYPEAGLVQGSDGNFYGTTYEDGASIAGTVFKISASGALTSLYSFTDGNDGGFPEAGLVQGSDGNFYGTTSDAVFGGNGTVFRLSVGLTVAPAAPVFQTVTLTNGTLSLTWSTEAGGTYQLQYNSDLSSSNWINMSSAITATGATLSTTDSLTNGPQRFYRLVLSR